MPIRTVPVGMWSYERPHINYLHTQEQIDAANYWDTCF